MKLTIQTTHLKQALTVSGRAVPSRSTLPALDCVLLEAHVDGGLTVTGTDLERRASLTVPASVTEAGAILLTARRLTDFVGALDGGETTIRVGENKRTSIKSGRGEFTPAGLSAEEFPIGTDFSAPLWELTLPGAAFAELIGSVAHAVAPDDSRPVLAGVLLTLQGGVLTATAADSFQLAIQHTPGDDGDWSVIVRGKGLAEVAKALPDVGTVRLATDGRAARLLVESGAGVWHLPLIDGQFPDVNRFIPRETATTLTVDRAALLRAVRLVAPVARDNSLITRLTVAEGMLTISAKNATETAETTVDVTLTGEPLTWAVNNTYLRQALESLNGETVTVQANGPGMPSVVHTGNRQAGVRVVMAMTDAR